MTKTQISTETLTWLEANSELLEKLDRMRRIEADDTDMNVVRIELDMLELIKSIGADSLGRCVQSKKAEAIALQKNQAASRIHKKNSLAFWEKSPWRRVSCVREVKLYVPSGVYSA